MFSQDSAYVKFIKSVNVEEIINMNFKSSPDFTHVMDNVSKSQGEQYMKCIEEEFPDITYDDLRNFINMNDKYGNAKKVIYEKQGKLLYSNPSNMRYIYFALLILTDYKSCTGGDMVEIGSGYGGLFLAINYFSKRLDIVVGNVFLVDLPEVNVITAKYLSIHASSITIPYELVSANNLNWKNVVTRPYLVSNYCFTEIDDCFRTDYVARLFPQIHHGFLAWQTCMSPRMDASNVAIIINKHVSKIERERPQTGPSHAENYFVYF
jgi:hypothetical protein